MKKFILLFVLISSVILPQTNITWTNVTPNYPSLPQGVKLWHGVRTSPALNAFYYDVDLNNTSIAVVPYYTTSIATVPALCGRIGAYGAINGGFFGGTSSYSAVVTPGQVQQQNIAALTRSGKTYPVIRSFFYLKNNFQPFVDWIYHFGSTVNDVYSFNAPLQYIANDPTPKPVPLSSQGTKIQELMLGVGGGPMLVKNGVKNITYNEEIMWGSGVGTDPDPRTAVGFTANKHVIMIVADGRLPGTSEGFSMDELANVFIALGCTDAINLDGGGSSQISVGSQAINITATRQLPTILAIVNRDSLHVPATPLFQKTIDSGDPEASVIGGWNPSSNPGYWGTTPCLLSPIGDGSNYVKYKLNLPKRAVYKVQAWWVDANNRATNTPFVIKHDGNTDTVKMNQTTNGARWVDVGQYTFNGDTTECIIISNKATTNQYVAADAVRINSFDSVFTAVNENKNIVLDNYSLEQNYPNPFNPSTTIKYAVKERGLIKLAIYDVLGKEVRTLVNESQSAGNYEVNFNAASLTSGVYFYKLNTGNFSSVKKMILMK